MCWKSMLFLKHIYINIIFGIFLSKTMQNQLSWSERGTVCPKVVGSISEKIQLNPELKSTWICAT